MASAAYRAGEKLHSEYYGEDSDYTRKGGVICSEILLQPHAPPEYADRETLWNAVEKAERGKRAQLAYSFDIALQNEFSMQENIALAKQFLLQNFVSRGMVVDFAVHQPNREAGGISNPHFHIMCPIRPIEPDGRWGNKQRREYVLDEHGERVLDEAGNYVFNAVSSTDWGKPETLEAWRQAWADLRNQKFAEKNLDCRIDHRSYARQGIEQIPTVHEGQSVRAMEAKGIRTDKGDFNRWVRKTNAMLREAKNKIASLLEWLKTVKEELSKLQPPIPPDPRPGEFSKNYLIYPVKNMKITQPYNSDSNHRACFSGTPNDYPIDEACEDYKKSPFYCPCDEMVVVRTRVEEGATSGIWLESTSPVVTPSGTYPVITLMVLHPDNAEVEKLEGRTFSRGEIICHEGKEGNATGNHFHISVGTDKYNGGKYKNGWQDNSEGEWVLTPLGKTLKPEEAFYVDPTFTNIIDSNGIYFSTVPSAN